MQDDTRAYKWSIEHRIAYPNLWEVAPSPDGRHVLYTVQEPLLTEEKSEFINHLYLASLDDGEPVQLTFGEHNNTSPKWSPDGRYIAFLSSRSGKANVHVMRAGGGEAWALTRYDKTDVSALKWSPGGERMAYLLADPPTEEKENAQKAKDDAIQWDVDFDFTHLYVVPFSVGPRTLPEPQRLTEGRYHVVGFDWLPSGDTLAITHWPNLVVDSWTETRLATVPADRTSTEPAEIAKVADWATPVASPDGGWLACHTADQPVRWAFAGRVVLYPVSGGDPRPLAYTPNGASGDAIGWSADGNETYVLDQSGASSQLWALPVSGEPGRPLTDTPLYKTVPAANADGHIAFVGQDFDEPNAVYLLDPATDKPVLVAQPPLPDDWPDAPRPRTEAIRWQAPDGIEIEGLLTYPLGYEGGQRCPLIVSVHGGPAGVYSRSYVGALDHYADVPALAERGYAVLRPNPRGSTGYGREFRFANYHDWGGGDYRDIMAGVDHLIAQGVADEDRLGIMGWSYGGFMTSWVITQTHRFKAACVGAGVTNPLSFNGTADIPSFIPDYFGAEFWDDLEAYRQHSPVLHARGVRTPTLIQHGDQDERVPLGQGREFYNALKRQGVPVEMVIYPRQGHLVEEPRLRIDLARRSVDWLDRWVRGEAPRS